MTQGTKWGNLVTHSNNKRTRARICILPVVLASLRHRNESEQVGVLVVSRRTVRLSGYLVWPRFARGCANFVFSRVGGPMCRIVKTFFRAIYSKIVVHSDKMPEQYIHPAFSKETLYHIPDKDAIISCHQSRAPLHRQQQRRANTQRRTAKTYRTVRAKWGAMSTTIRGRQRRLSSTERLFAA